MALMPLKISRGGREHAHASSIDQAHQETPTSGDFTTLMEAIKSRPLSSSERQRFLATIMAETVNGDVTPAEAKKLTKAITGDIKRRT